MKRIGILGGTFDPIHFGHLMLGKQAFSEYTLDEVWYMPSRQPPHKRSHHITSSVDRLEMVRLAISEIPYFKTSDFELKRRGGNTYTVDTLKLLNEVYPDTDFFFIVGADSIFDIEKWYHPEEVLKLTTFLAADREGDVRERTLEEQISYLKKKYGAKILKLHLKEMEIASEDIRNMIQKKEDVSALIPDIVIRYINEHGLYGNTDKGK